MTVAQFVRGRVQWNERDAVVDGRLERHGAVDLNPQNEALFFVAHFAEDGDDFYFVAHRLKIADSQATATCFFIFL